MDKKKLQFKELNFNLLEQIAKRKKYSFKSDK